MAEIRPRLEVIQQKNSTSYAIGATGIQYVIPRQNRRLERLTLHANITLATTQSAGAATDAMEGLFSRISVKGSDSAGDDRSFFNQNSSTLLHWWGRHAGRHNRFNQTVIGQTANGTYDVIVPLSFVHPLAQSPARLYQTLPLWAKNADGIGLGSDLQVEVDVSALDSSCFKFTGTSAFTFNFVRLMAHYREIPDATLANGGLPYVPMQLATQDFDNGASSGENVVFQLAEDGLLSSLLFEEFSSSTTGARGQVLTTDTTGFYNLQFGPTPIWPVYPKFAAALDGEWAQEWATDVAPGSTHNPNVRIFTHNFWHDTPLAEARLANTLPNLYTKNKGDLLTIRPNSIQANKRLRVTSHKFLTNNGALLTGA